MPVPLGMLAGISLLRVALTPDLRQPDSRRAMLLLLQVTPLPRAVCAGCQTEADQEGSSVPLVAALRRSCSGRAANASP